MSRPLCLPPFHCRTRAPISGIGLFLDVASPALAQPNETGTVPSPVRNQVTAAPRRGASVIISDNERHFAPPSDDDSFRLNRVPAVVHTLVANSTGLTHSKRTKYQAYENRQLDPRTYGMRIAAGIGGEF